MANQTKRGSYYQGPNNQYYYIEVVLYNQVNEPLYVPFFNIESLNIQESLFNWVTTGEIVFNNDFEIFLRGSTNDPNSQSQSSSPPYIDRGDGRSRIHVTLYPVNVKITNGNIAEENSESFFPKKYYEINYDFVIYEIQDIPVDNNQRKKRMYKFYDERYQILKEKNLEWSSEMIASRKLGITNRNLTSAECALNPNEVLKEFLKLISTNGDTMPKINVGFSESGSIASPDIPFDKIEDALWDIGNLNNLVTFYKTSNSNGITDLNYILSHCESYDGFPVILDYGRSSQDKGWHLNSLSYYFENSTPFQVEHFIIEDGLDSQNQTYIPRASNSSPTQTNNFISMAASRITSYMYSPMVALDDNRIKNLPYVYYNEHTGGFSFIKKDNSVQNLKAKLEELANKGLYSFKGGGQGGQILLNLNKTKLEGQMTENRFALNGPFSNVKSPINQMILDAIFLNQSITFQTLGLTLRAPGKFIFIDRVGAGEKNAFDDRFLGQWLITKVSHLFTQDTYITEIIANKMDAFSSILPVEDGKY